MLVLILILLNSQNAFSDELLNSPAKASTTKTTKTSSSTNLPKGPSRKAVTSETKAVTSETPSFNTQPSVNNLGSIDSGRKATYGEPSPRPLSPSPSNDLIGLGADKLWRIKPGFDFKTAYDSNVNREPPGQQNSDVIFSYIPSIDVHRRGTKLDVKAGYQMNFQEYVKDSDQNAFNHTAKGVVKYTGNKIKTILSESFSWAKTYAGDEHSERTPIFVNSFTREVIYSLTPKVSASTIYNNYIFMYREGTLKESSYVVNDIGGRVYYHATPKLDLYLHGSGNTTEYYRSHTQDSQGYSILVGAKGQVTRKLVTDLQTGFKGQTYDNATFNSFYDWVVQGIFQYRLTRKLDTSLALRRNRQESVYSNTGWYEANSLAWGLNYRITSRIYASLDASIQGNRYARETTEGTRTKKRKDLLLTGGSTLNWRAMRHLLISLGYNYRQRDSNFDNIFDYVEHVVESTASYQFS